jgi:hypothetical protein
MSLLHRAPARVEHLTKMMKAYAADGSFEAQYGDLRAATILLLLPNFGNRTGTSLRHFERWS